MTEFFTIFEVSCIGKNDFAAPMIASLRGTLNGNGLRQMGVRNMIVRGDFVFDWMGQPGIAIEQTSPADEAELDPVLDWPLKGLPERTTWWIVALCEGGIVKSPELRTQSLVKPASRC